MEFSSVKALNKYIINAINDVIEDISFEIEVELRDKVREAYLSSPSNKNDFFKYTPTYDFVNSVTRARATTKDKNSITIELYFDPKKMKPEYREDEYWNAHMGFMGETENVWNGMSVSELLPYWIEYGTQRGMFPRKGTDSVGKVFRLYEQIFPQLIIRELNKRYGIKAN